MRRIVTPFARLMALTSILLSLPAFGAELTPQKGPMLSRVEDHQVVRIQAPGLGKPILEWREKAGDSEKKEEMSAQGSAIWQAKLPDQAIEYRIVDGDRSMPWQPVLNGGKDKDKFTFLAYGDNRSGWGSPQVHQSLVNHMELEKAAFALNTGDIVFHGEKEAQWQLFFDQTRRIFASVPFQPSKGNHDYSKADNYEKYFGFGEGGESYYYFSYGRAEFIALDTAKNFGPGSPQSVFLENRLKKIKGASPIVVFFHHPAYSWSKHSGDPRVLSYLVPLFEKYGVDLVLTGHDHNYQRVGPINGVTYIVTGGGGGPLYRVRENPLLKNYKVVYHYISFEVDDKKMVGTMKYRPEVGDDRFEILYRDKSGEPQAPEERKALEKAKP